MVLYTRLPLRPEESITSTGTYRAVLHLELIRVPLSVLKFFLSLVTYTNLERVLFVFFDVSPPGYSSCGGAVCTALAYSSVSSRTAVRFFGPPVLLESSGRVRTLRGLEKLRHRIDTVSVAPERHTSAQPTREQKLLRARP